MSKHTNKVYANQVKRVLAFFKTAHVATKSMIIETTKLKPHVIQRMISDGILTTSLNYGHNWIIPTKTIRLGRDHWGFYRCRIKRYSRTVPIFHVKRSAKAALSYLASSIPWGLTEKEAEEYTGRDCSRVLGQLVEAHAIQVRLLNGEKVYVNRKHKKADTQLHHRRTNPRLKKEDEEEKENVVGIIPIEEFCQVFRSVLDEMNVACEVPDERLAALQLMFYTNRTLRTMETWIEFNPRIMNAMGLSAPVDHSTLSRAFTDVSEEFLRELFHNLVLKLHDKGVITGRFIVIDATHIYAYRNTRLNTTDNPVEGADWGWHHGSFFGYKVHILVDADSEMPVMMIISSGEESDRDYFLPLIEDFKEKYEFDDILAVLADAAYDEDGFRAKVKSKLGCPFLAACNPRRNKSLKMVKEMVRKLFKKHGAKIKSVKDAFRYLRQRYLTEFGLELGSKVENKLVELIEERLHRPFRASIERLISRLKAISAFERPKSRALGTVIKTVWWCLIGTLVQALTAHNKGFPGSMRKRTMLV